MKDYKITPDEARKCRDYFYQDLLERKICDLRSQGLEEQEIFKRLISSSEVAQRFPKHRSQSLKSKIHDVFIRIKHFVTRRS